jgi:hypothetical protein
MYLIIFEDGTINKTDRIEEDDRDMASEGVVELLNIAVPHDPMRFGPDGWESIDAL